MLQDFAALQEMLVEVAKWEFRRANPKRKRVPRRFTEGVDLHLTSVEDGSAILTISLVFAGLFPASENLEYFQQAKAAIVDTIAAADRNEALTLPPSLLNYFDRFGRGLRAGDSISFEGRAGTVVLTPETRTHLLRHAEVSEWTEETSLRVRIPEADKGRKTFEAELTNGTKLKADLKDIYSETILDAFHNYGSGTEEYVLLQGSVKRDRDNPFKAIASVEHATPLDPLDLALRLEQLGLLQDGWLDGQGLAPQQEGLQWMAGIFDASLDAQLPLPHLYPTPEGGLQAEWNLADWSVSLEIDLRDHRGEFQALNLRRTEELTELNFNLDEPEDWNRLNTALLNLSKNEHGVSA